MMTMRHLLPALLATLIMTGCATRSSLYQWGSYENQVYAMYADQGKTSPQEQIAQLEADIEKARAANKALPPGHYAHLGYLYFQTGRREQAIASFETEERLFPEARPYMTRLIARAKQ